MERKLVPLLNPQTGGTSIVDSAWLFIQYTCSLYVEDVFFICSLRMYHAMVIRDPFNMEGIITVLNFEKHFLSMLHMQISSLFYRQIKASSAYWHRKLQK
jgi:hypothetical protein